MNLKALVSVLAMLAGLGVCASPAAAAVRPGVFDGRGEVQAATRLEPLVYLGPDQRREMRQQMREQWRQQPPRSDEWRQEYRERQRDRWQQMPSDDRYRLREEMREQRGGRGRDFGGGRR